MFAAVVKAKGDILRNNRRIPCNRIGYSSNTIKRHNYNKYAQLEARRVLRRNRGDSLSLSLCGIFPAHHVLHGESHCQTHETYFHFYTRDGAVSSIDTYAQCLYGVSVSVSVSVMNFIGMLIDECFGDGGERKISAG